MEAEHSILDAIRKREKEFEHRRLFDRIASLQLVRECPGLTEELAQTVVKAISMRLIENVRIEY